MAVPITILLAVLFENVAITAANGSGARLSDTSVWALNTAPSALAGVIVFAVTAGIVHSTIRDAGQVRWIWRAVVPVLVALGLGVWLLLDAPFEGDFWFYGQLLIWPSVALTAGLLSEVVLTRALRRRSNVTAA